MDEILQELCEIAVEEGLDANVLRLWSKGKCIGGPTFEIGLETPKLCAAMADYMEGKRHE